MIEIIYINITAYFGYYYQPTSSNDIDVQVIKIPTHLQ